MANITFITPEGERIDLVGESGSVMQLAVANGVPGIDGDCGGVCSCATCHVHVDQAFVEKTGEASEIESDMLEFAEDLSEYSRLSCQLKISEELDGIVLTVAKED